MSETSSGKLFIVPTPIGNLKDITVRAVEVLCSVDLILCEDTRHSRKLLTAHDIKTPLRSFHDHNEKERLPKILQELQLGSQIALISDAGTPLISDPGYPLIRALVAAGVAVEALPGPCALISALVLSALPSDRFYFQGFLPPKSAARVRRFRELIDIPATLIFYESTHRIEKFLRDAYSVFGSRSVVLAREMTKLYEEIVRSELAPDGIATPPRSWKGEFVVLIASGSKGLQPRSGTKRY